MIDIKRLYDTRFTTFERVRRRVLWKILCKDFLQHFIYPRDTVVDLGAGQCEFINSILCKRRIAVDINEDVKKFAERGVEVKIAPVKFLRKIFRPDSIDVIFMSNFLEHLDSKEEVFRLLNESYHVLKRGGRLLILQPDIALVGGEYWDFFDHKVPITYASLTEALLANQFKIAANRYPFLPYSTKVKYVPLWPPLLRLYLKISFLHRLFGKQFFICAEK